MNDGCRDCGLHPAHGVVLLTQEQAIGDRVIEWKICGRCWIRRGAETQVGNRQSVGAAESVST